MNLKITNENKHFSSAPENIGNTNSVKKNYSDADKQKLAKASMDFEGLLTSMMIKSMTSTTEGLFGDSGFGGDTMESVFEGEFANFISKSNGMGVADMIYKKLTGEELEKTMLNVKEAVHKIEIPKPEKSEETKNSKIDIENSNFEKSITPSSKAINRVNRYDDFIKDASEKYGVDENIIKSVILAESAGNEKAISHAKAKGLMQMIDSTANDMGVKNVWDPKDNIHGGTKYLSGLLRQYNGDLKLALAAYNAGPGNVAKHNGIPPFKETKTYITRVLGYLNHLNG